MDSPATKRRLAMQDGPGSPIPSQDPQLGSSQGRRTTTSGRAAGRWSASRSLGFGPAQAPSASARMSSQVWRPSGAGALPSHATTVPATATSRHGLPAPASARLSSSGIHGSGIERQKDHQPGSHLTHGHSVGLSQGLRQAQEPGLAAVRPARRRSSVHISSSTAPSPAPFTAASAARSSIPGAPSCTAPCTTAFGSQAPGSTTSRIAAPPQRPWQPGAVPGSQSCASVVGSATSTPPSASVSAGGVLVSTAGVTPRGCLVRASLGLPAASTALTGTPRSAAPTCSSLLRSCASAGGGAGPGCHSSCHHHTCHHSASAGGAASTAGMGLGQHRGSGGGGEGGGMARSHRRSASGDVAGLPVHASAAPDVSMRKSTVQGGNNARPVSLQENNASGAGRQANVRLQQQPWRLSGAGGSSSRSMSLSSSGGSKGTVGSSNSGGDVSMGGSSGGGSRNASSGSGSSLAPMRFSLSGGIAEAPRAIAGTGTALRSSQADGKYTQGSLQQEQGQQQSSRQRRMSASASVTSVLGQHATSWQGCAHQSDAGAASMAQHVAGPELTLQPERRASLHSPGPLILQCKGRAGEESGKRGSLQDGERDELDGQQQQQQQRLAVTGAKTSTSTPPRPVLRDARTYPQQRPPLSPASAGAVSPSRWANAKVKAFSTAGAVQAEHSCSPLAASELALTPIVTAALAASSTQRAVASETAFALLTPDTATTERQQERHEASAATSDLRWHTNVLTPGTIAPATSHPAAERQAMSLTPGLALPASSEWCTAAFTLDAATPPPQQRPHVAHQLPLPQSAPPTAGFDSFGDSTSAVGLVQRLIANAVAQLPALSPSFAGRSTNSLSPAAGDNMDASGTGPGAMQLTSGSSQAIHSDQAVPVLQALVWGLQQRLLPVLVQDATVFEDRRWEIQMLHQELRQMIADAEATTQVVQQLQEQQLQQQQQLQQLQQERQRGRSPLSHSSEWAQSDAWCTVQDVTAGALTSSRLQDKGRPEGTDHQASSLIHSPNALVVASQDRWAAANHAHGAAYEQQLHGTPTRNSGSLSPMAPGSTPVVWLMCSDNEDEEEGEQESVGRQSPQAAGLCTSAAQVRCLVQGQELRATAGDDATGTCEVVAPLPIDRLPEDPEGQVAQPGLNQVEQPQAAKQRAQEVTGPAQAQAQAAEAEELAQDAPTEVDARMQVHPANDLVPAAPAAGSQTQVPPATEQVQVQVPALGQEAEKVPQMQVHPTAEPVQVQALVEEAGTQAQVHVWMGPMQVQVRALVEEAVPQERARHQDVLQAALQEERKKLQEAQEQQLVWQQAAHEQALRELRELHQAAVQAAEVQGQAQVHAQQQLQQVRVAALREQQEGHQSTLQEALAQKRRRLEQVNSEALHEQQERHHQALQTVLEQEWEQQQGAREEALRQQQGVDEAAMRELQVQHQDALRAAAQQGHELQQAAVEQALQRQQEQHREAMAMALRQGTEEREEALQAAVMQVRQCQLQAQEEAQHQLHRQHQSALGAAVKQERGRQQQAQEEALVEQRERHQKAMEELVEQERERHQTLLQAALSQQQEQHQTSLEKAVQAERGQQQAMLEEALREQQVRHLEALRAECEQQQGAHDEAMRQQEVQHQQALQAQVQAERVWHKALQQAVQCEQQRYQEDAMQAVQEAAMMAVHHAEQEVQRLRARLQSSEEQAEAARGAEAITRAEAEATVLRLQQELAQAIQCAHAVQRTDAVQHASDQGQLEEAVQSVQAELAAAAEQASERQRQEEARAQAPRTTKALLEVERCILEQQVAVAELQAEQRLQQQELEWKERGAEDKANWEVERSGLLARLEALVTQQQEAAVRLRQEADHRAGLEIEMKRSEGELAASVVQGAQHRQQQEAAKMQQEAEHRAQWEANSSCLQARFEADRVRLEDERRRMEAELAEAMQKVAELQRRLEEQQQQVAEQQSQLAQQRQQDADRAAAAAAGKVCLEEAMGRLESELAAALQQVAQQQAADKDFVDAEHEQVPGSLGGTMAAAGGFADAKQDPPVLPANALSPGDSGAGSYASCVVTVARRHTTHDCLPSTATASEVQNGFASPAPVGCEREGSDKSSNSQPSVAWSNPGMESLGLEAFRSALGRTDRPASMAPAIPYSCGSEGASTDASAQFTQDITAEGVPGAVDQNISITAAVARSPQVARRRHTVLGLGGRRSGGVASPCTAESSCGTVDAALSTPGGDRGVATSASGVHFVGAGGNSRGAARRTPALLGSRRSPTGHAAPGSIAPASCAAGNMAETSKDSVCTSAVSPPGVLARAHAGGRAMPCRLDSPESAASACSDRVYMSPSLGTCLGGLDGCRSSTKGHTSSPGSFPLNKRLSGSNVGSPLHSFPVARLTGSNSASPLSDAACGNWKASPSGRSPSPAQAGGQSKSVRLGTETVGPSADIAAAEKHRTQGRLPAGVCSSVAAVPAGHSGQSTEAPVQPSREPGCAALPHVREATHYPPVPSGHGHTHTHRPRGLPRPCTAPPVGSEAGALLRLARPATAGSSVTGQGRGWQQRLLLGLGVGLSVSAGLGMGAAALVVKLGAGARGSGEVAARGRVQAGRSSSSPLPDLHAGLAEHNKSE